MCGIAGFTSFRSRPDAYRDILERMTRVLQHRGPDGEGFYRDDAISMGHRRLAIIDAAGGAQPMSSPDGRFQVAYNGEVYNYLELRKELETRGEVFRTQSDTEVMLRLFTLEGARALERFDGM
ncbi:MAG TPA: asparagine synthetase B, partial [Kiritimatiellia bacterium]